METFFDLLDQVAARFVWVLFVFSGAFLAVLVLLLGWALGYLSRCRDERVSPAWLEERSRLEAQARDGESG